MREAFPEGLEVGLDEIRLEVHVTFWDQDILNSNLNRDKSRMSLKEVLCVPEHRDALCKGIKSSINAIGLDANVLVEIGKVLDSGTPAQKNYLILFAIVRLAGLYEVIAPKSSERARVLLNNLYQDLNNHISKP